MNEFDFTQLKNLKTPAEWVEAAVNIPQKKQKPVFVFLRPQFIGSAAAVVLVTAAVLMTLLLQQGTPKPSFTPAPVMVTTAATEPSESISPITTQAAVPTTPATQATERETVVTASEPSTERVTAATRATSPQISTTAATVPATVPPTTPEAPTQAATQQPTQAATQTATQTATQPATDLPGEEVNATEETEPADPPVEPPSEVFEGSVAVRISPKCPLYNSKYLYIEVLDKDGRKQNHYTIIRKLTDGEIVFYPQIYSMFLYSGEDYILRVYDNNGNDRRAWFFTPESGNIEIHIND